MVRVQQAQEITLSQLTELFNLSITYDSDFFREWLDDLPEIADWEKQALDRVKRNYLSLIARHPVSENSVKMVVVEHLLDLADFYLQPFDIQDEMSVELSVADADTIVRGRLDFIIFKNRLWLAVIESKNAGVSLRKALPQALAYMLDNPNPEQPIFGFLTNGDDFCFIKLSLQGYPQYALSDKFTLWKTENELYRVSSILKKLGQAIGQ